MNKCYYRIVWENYPSDKTPLNEQNLNKIDVATDEMDNRIISLDAAKFDKSEAQLLVKYIEYDEDTGIFKITHYNGASYTIDTLLEKLAINFDYDYQTQRLIIALSDGTVKYVDLSALITQYEFLNSGTIAFTLQADGKVTADIIEGSIEERHLRPNYLADIKVEASKAETSATAAETSKTAAANSASMASTKAEEAATSAANAANSATAAEESKTAADASATMATNKANEAATSATNAADSKNAADASATSAENSANTATNKANAASASAASADTYAKQAQSYAVGTGGVRPNEAVDSAKFYYEQSKSISEGLSGVLQPMGTVTFANLPLLANVESGWMYNISDEFTTDSTFKEGIGRVIPAGSNVYKTADGFWDVLAGSPVTAVNGETGNVEVTPEKIGAAAKDEVILKSSPAAIWLERSARTFVYGADYAGFTEKYPEGYYKIAETALTNIFTEKSIMLRVNSDNSINFPQVPTTFWLKFWILSAGNKPNVVVSGDPNSLRSRLVSDFLFVKYPSTGIGICSLYFKRTAPRHKIVVDVLDEEARNNIVEPSEYHEFDIWMISNNSEVTPDIEESGYDVKSLEQCCISDDLNTGTDACPIYMKGGIPTEIKNIGTSSDHFKEAYIDTINVQSIKGVLENVDNTSDIDKPVSTAQQAAMDDLYQQLTAYTQAKIAEMINGAPTSMDTLKEVSDAIAAHKSVMDALDAAIGKKASAAEFDSHAKDTAAHITAAERNAWNGKQAAITGAASTVTANNLTANRALVSNGSGKLAASAVTATELGYLDGVTSNVQGQLNELNTGLAGKAPSSHSHNDLYYTKTEVSAGMAGKADSGHTHDDRYYTEAEINKMLPLQHFITGVNIVPTALGKDYAYTNAALKGKTCIVAIFYSSVGNVLVTSYASSRGVLNIKDGDQYWGGEVQVAYNSSTGTVTFKVVWIGGSQILSNFALTDVLY